MSRSIPDPSSARARCHTGASRQSRRAVASATARCFRSSKRPHVKRIEGLRIPDERPAMLGDHLGADRDRRAGHRGRTPATPRCPAVRRYPASTQGRPFPAGLGSRRGGARKHPAATVADLSTAASAAVSDVESAGRSSTTGRAARRRRRTPSRGAALESAPAAWEQPDDSGRSPPPPPEFPLTPTALAVPAWPVPSGKDDG